MSKSRIELGRRGEQAAVNFLKNSGYNIIRTNYRTRLGQIDIIAKDRKTICFVEVKTRRTQRFGRPDEAVEASKQKKISRVALVFLKQNRLFNSPARFDVLSIYYPGYSNSLRVSFPNGVARKSESSGSRNDAKVVTKFGVGCRSNTLKSNYIRHLDMQPKIELTKNAFELDYRYLY